MPKKKQPTPPAKDKPKPSMTTKAKPSMGPVGKITGVAKGLVRVPLDREKRTLMPKKKK
jgi:hypothetical protein